MAHILYKLLFSIASSHSLDMPETSSNNSLLPLPKTPHPAPFPPQNAGNTCYLDSLLVALFSSQDIADSLLTPPSPNPNTLPLLSTLRASINHLRAGTVLPRPLISTLRKHLISHGWHSGSSQQDAAELYGFLWDLLAAPFLPLFSMLSHSGVPDPSDESPTTERLLWLEVKDGASIAGMLDHYFFEEELHGLRRGKVVNAKVTKRLLPFYTPLRETGETVDARRPNFRYLSVPLALGRFRQNGTKNRARIRVATAISATRYVGRMIKTIEYTLILRSVVCHLGSSIRIGHYICYTFEPTIGWRRWNDLDGSQVKTVKGRPDTGLPSKEEWAHEIEHDGYLCFYELVPGDGEAELKGGRGTDVEGQVRGDEWLARQSQTEEDHFGAVQEHFRHGGILVGGDKIHAFACWNKD